MTAEEFDEKYNKWLEKGHYGLSISNERQIDYLNEVFEGLTLIDGFSFSQIKSKFGSYRFYCSSNVPLGTQSKVEAKLKELENERIY